MSIKIFTTGGTIDKTYFDQKDTYHVGAPQAAGILERANVAVDYEVIPLLQKDSLDISDTDREFIFATIKAAPDDKIIITHGTDSMIETAKSLQSITGKTIVLTGSMLPSQYRDSDAIFNMGCAVMAVQTLGSGIYIVMNGRFFDPLTSAKNVTLNKFEDSEFIQHRYY